MNDKRNLTGHPWHIGYLKMDEFDSKRDKRRCIYFFRDEYNKNYCKKNFMNCIGSSHCSNYEEAEVKNSQNYKHIKNKNEKPDVIYKDFNIKVIKENIYNDVMELINNEKSKIKFTYVDIPVQNKHSFKVINFFRCLTNTNGKDFYITYDKNYNSLINKVKLENININFEIINTESAISFLNNLYVKNKNKSVKLINKLAIKKSIKDLELNKICIDVINDEIYSDIIKKFSGKHKLFYIDRSIKNKVSQKTKYEIKCVESKSVKHKKFIFISSTNYKDFIMEGNINLINLQ